MVNEEGIREEQFFLSAILDRAAKNTITTI